MTPTQLTALKADILANHSAQWVAGQVGIIAESYNVQATPDFTVWKTSLSAAEMHKAYVWTEMDTLAQSKYNQLTLMLSQGSVNPSVANVRQGFNDIFTGGALVGTRTALIALAKRLVTVGEKLFATGTGSDAVPGELTFEGRVTPQDIYEAMSNG
jgi:hypothetical protein